MISVNEIVRMKEQEVIKALKDSFEKLGSSRGKVITADSISIPINERGTIRYGLDMEYFRLQQRIRHLSYLFTREQMKKGGPVNVGNFAMFLHQRGEINSAEVPEESEPVIQQRYPCGCVTCICDDDVQCQGCGATACDDYKGPTCGCAQQQQETER